MLHNLKTEFPDKLHKGRTDYWINCEKHEATTEGMAVGGRSAHILKRMRLSGEADTRPRMPATNSAFNTLDIEKTGLS